MSVYAADAAGAAADLAVAGAPVSFSRKSGGSVDPTTDRRTGTSTVTGNSSAIEKRPTGADLKRYEALGLTIVETVVLLVAAQPLGSFVPKPGDVETWVGRNVTVRDVAKLAPDGVPILYTVAAS